MRARLAVILGLVLLAGLARTGRGQTSGSSPVTLVGAAGRSLTDGVLVGNRGEIYRRDNGTWRRQAGGGVAVTLVTAFGPTGAEIWGAGTTVPPYRYDGSAWSSSPLTMQGGMVMATGGTPAVGVARRVMVQSKGAWSQLPTTGATSLTAVAASGPLDATVLTSDGDVRRYNGTSWKIMKPTLAAGETLVRLFPGPGGTVVAAGSAGTLLVVGKTALTPLKLDARLTGFVPVLGGVSSKLLLVGSATVSGQPRQVLASVDGGQLTLVDPLPALAAGDRPAALLVAGDGAVAVGTTAGKVLVRSAAGAWSTETVDPSLPTDNSHPQNPPASST